MVIFRFLKKFGSWVLVAIISISFVAYIGLNSSSISPNKIVVGRVDGYPVSASRGTLFTDIYDNLSNLYVSNGYSFDQNVKKNVVQRAFYEEVALYLAGKKSRELGFSLDDTRVWSFIKDKYYRNDPVFFGKFQQDNISFKKTVFSKVKNTIFRDYLEASIFGGIPLSKFEFQHLLALASLQKKALVGAVRIKDNLKKFIEDEELNKYFDKNKDRYQEKDKKEIFLHDVREKVLSDYLVEYYDQTVENVRDYYYKEISEIMVKVNTDKGKISDKRKLFVLELKKIGVSMGETGYLSFFMNETPFLDSDFSLEADNVILDIMKTSVGKSNIIAFSKNELKIVFTLEEKRENYTDSSFIFKRYKKNFFEVMQNRMRTQYYKKYFEDVKIDFTYGSNSEKGSF